VTGRQTKKNPLQQLHSCYCIFSTDVLQTLPPQEREIQRLRALLATYTSAAGVSSSPTGSPVSNSSSLQQARQWLADASADGTEQQQQQQQQQQTEEELQEVSQCMLFIPMLM
jgi:hypothetical protein